MDMEGRGRVQPGQKAGQVVRAGKKCEKLVKGVKTEKEIVKKALFYIFLASIGVF